MDYTTLLLIFGAVMALMWLILLIMTILYLVVKEWRMVFFGLISLCLASAFVAQTYTATVQSIERKENVKRAEDIFKSLQRDIYINGEPVSENFNPDAINLVEYTIAIIDKKLYLSK